MIVAGIDIGSRTAKAVILQDRDIISYSIIDTGYDSAETAYKVMDESLKKVGLSFKDMSYIIATGYGRVVVPFANKNITEISCHAKGANWLIPSVRTILDMGGQDCKAIRCNEKGEVTNFIMNDKCAGGTGRFLEIIAHVMGLPLGDIGGLSLQSEEKIDFSTVCAVFAKSNVMSLLRKGKQKKDILAGVHDAIATRVFAFLQRVGVEKDLVITGGIAKNIGVVKKLEEKVNLDSISLKEPQIVGALGAALFATSK